MDSSMSTIQTGYDRWAMVYDHDANPLPALEEPVMMRMMGSVQGKRVLDVGCGTGRHTLWLQAAGAQVTAMDFSAGMLSKAKQKPGMSSVEFLVHDLHQPWPVAERSFDAIISGLVMEHLQHLVPFFTEIRRVVKPGGKVVLSTLHPAMFLRGSQARFTDPETGQIVQPGSVNHTYGEMVLAALGAGFRILELMEQSPDAAFALQYPRAEKYVGWPMLLVMSLIAD
jgi:ubiquinone/menaquinone biosynthesis C-methylase UbiE